MVSPINVDKFRGAEPLTFDFDLAQTVASDFRSASAGITDQLSPRATLAGTAMNDFKGSFAEGFKFNTERASEDGSELANVFTTIAASIDELARVAREENERRRLAREYVARHDDLANHDGWWDTITDFVQQLGPAPEVPHSDPVVQPLQPSVNASLRVSPLEFASASTGVSSANPENLRTFARGSASLNEELSHWPSKLRTGMEDFASRCQFGTINADGALQCFDTWARDNTNDVDWANSIAAAFEAAGGSGAVSVLSNAALFATLNKSNVTVSRSELVVPVPQVKGGTMTTGYIDDPINSATGNFLEPELDLAFPGAASSLRAERMYNSISESNGSFGPGWDSIFDIRLSFDQQGATFVMSDGRELFFPRLGNGWDQANAANYWLNEHTGNTSNLLVVSDNQGTQYSFTLAGQWVGLTRGPGTRIDVERDEHGYVHRLNHERGRWIQVERQEPEHDSPRALITGLTGSDGRRVNYEYDESGQLISTAASDSGTRRYEWNNQGLISAVIDAHGVVEARNTYDEHGRVTTQTSPFGRTSRFSYLPGLVTNVSDMDGTRSNTFISDAYGRLISVVDGHDQQQSMTYDIHGNLLSALERDGGVTRHLYNARGLRIRTKTRDGADLNYSYDQFDRVTTVMAANGAVTTFEYPQTPALQEGTRRIDIPRNPTLITDPGGGRSELHWDNGLLVKVIDPTGVCMDLGYDGFGDLVSVANAVGDTARFERDAAGRLVKAVSAGGAVTEYSYDASGNVQRVRDAEGNLWRYEYAANSRLVASIDPTGARTTYEYDEIHGQLIRTVDPLGRATESTYDDFGRICAVVLPSQAVWALGYDLLSDLRTVTDPTGGIWHNEYTVNGELSATVDPTGVRQTIHRDSQSKTVEVANAFEHGTISLDKMGRPVKTVGTDDSAEVLVYDSAGRVVEYLDTDGGLNKFTYDLAGRVVSKSSPSGAATSFTYDAAGRPKLLTEPDGSQMRLEYDADSRIIARHYGGINVPEEQWQSSHTVYDKLGRILVQGASQYQYDGAGRVTALQDPVYGTRRFRYDAAGQLTSVVNGVGGVTHFGYDQAGNQTSVTDPLGHTTTREFDAAGRLTSVTDPLGRVTTTSYDLAGRVTSQCGADGRQLRFTYDSAGELCRLDDGNKLLAEYQRDYLARSITISDHTHRSGNQVEHQLSYDRRGNLVSHRRDNATTYWRYDEDGQLTSLTDVTGTTVSMDRDSVGRITVVEHPVFGQIAYAYLGEGEVLASIATPRDTASPEVIQGWRHADGLACEYQLAVAGHEPETTLITRDDLGRIVGIRQGAGQMQYQFDAAHQLIGYHAAGEGKTECSTTDSASAEWVYDAAGRLIRETSQDAVTEYTYDPAGQLITRTTTSDDEVHQISYAYDRAGRRISERSSTEIKEYAWDSAGRLTRITTTALNQSTGQLLGEPVTQELWIDVLGQLAQVQDTVLSWDITAPSPQLLSIGKVSVTHAPAGNTIADGILSVSGWRPEHPTGPAAPWAQAPLSSTSPHQLTQPGSVQQMPSLPSGLSLTGNGQISLNGLDLLGARVYDPNTRGFLSTDPLDPVLGSGWAANPYAYAGNDPLHLTDPLGLSPVTQEQLNEFSEAKQGWFYDGLGKVNEVTADIQQGISSTYEDFSTSIRNGAAKIYDGATKMYQGVTGFFSDTFTNIGNWITDHPYIAGGIMIAAGIGLMFTGVGGPIGATLIGATIGATTSGGASLIAQQAVNGEVDTQTVLRDMLIGAVGGGAGGGVAHALTKGAKLAGTAISNGSSKIVPKAGNFMLQKKSARSAISAGTGGSTSNATDLMTDGKENSWTDYARSMAQGFGLGAGGAKVAGTLSKLGGDKVARSLPKLSTAFRKTRNSTHGDQSVRFNWAGFGVEQTVDRLVGGTFSYTNTNLGGNKEDDAALNSFIQGFTRGSAGAATGRH